MRMATLIDWHAIQRYLEVDSVIEIEASQKILIGFALATVLADDQTGNHLQYFTRPGDNAIVDLELTGRPFVGGVTDPD